MQRRDEREARVVYEGWGHRMPSVRGIEGDHLSRPHSNILLCETEVPENYVARRGHSISVLQPERCMSILPPPNLKQKENITSTKRREKNHSNLSVES